MPPVPSLPGSRVVNALEKGGFVVARVRGILADIGMTIEELKKLV